MSANEEVIPLLASVDLFREVPPKVLKTIAAAGRIVEHKPGHEVTSDGTRGAAFHLITEGTAEVEVRGKPRPGLKRGDGFGEISMIDGLPRTATVRAGTDGMTTFALASWDFLPILDENPTVSRTMLKVLCARIRTAEAPPRSSGQTGGHGRTDGFLRIGRHRAGRTGSVAAPRRWSPPWSSREGRCSRVCWAPPGSRG